MKIRVGTFNLFQFVEPPFCWYTKKEKFNNEEWIEKTTWIKKQICEMKCDIIGFQEVFSKDSLKKIIDLELKGLFKRVVDLGMKLELSAEAKDFIAERGYDVQFGARPLKRAIQRYLEDALADVVLAGSAVDGDTILMELNETKDTVVARVVKPQDAIDENKVKELPE